MREVKIKGDGEVSDVNSLYVFCPLGNMHGNKCSKLCAWYHVETGVANGIDAQRVAMCGNKTIGILKGD